MNKARRSRLKEIVDVLKNMVDKIDGIKGEEEEYLDSIPENLETSQRYSDSEDAIFNLEMAISSIEDGIDDINSAIV